ncbi:MAG: ABC transporter permease [Acidimicrobiales bacterium]
MATPMPLRIFEHQLVSYRRLWRGTLFVSFAQPVLFLLAFGVGIGSLVDDDVASSQRIGDVPYLAFVAPGLLAAACMVTAMVDATWPVMSAIKWSRQYHGMLASPLTSTDLVHGQVLWLLFRTTNTAVAMGLVLSIPSDTRGIGLVGSVGAGVLTGLAFGLPITAWTMSIERESHFTGLQRFVITPMYLFAGAMFPISQLPRPFRAIAYVTPLYHGVALSRGFALRTLDSAAVVHVTVLVAFIVAGYLWARRTYPRRLSP